MIRSIAVLALFAAGLGAATAQEATATPPAAAPANVVVDPSAQIDTTPKQANLLTGMYATQAVIELCAISLEEGVVNGMSIDQKRLETSLSMDATTAGQAYAKVKADVEKTTPDCAAGSPDRLSVDAVTGIYQDKTAASATTAAPAAIVQ